MYAYTGPPQKIQLENLFSPITGFYLIVSIQTTREASKDSILTPPSPAQREV